MCSGISLAFCRAPVPHGFVERLDTLLISLTRTIRLRVGVEIQNGGERVVLSVDFCVRLLASVPISQMHNHSNI